MADFAGGYGARIRADEAGGRVKLCAEDEFLSRVGRVDQRVRTDGGVCGRERILAGARRTSRQRRVACGLGARREPGRMGGDGKRRTGERRDAGAAAGSAWSVSYADKRGVVDGIDGRDVEGRRDKGVGGGDGRAWARGTRGRSGRNADGRLVYVDISGEAGVEERGLGRSIKTGEGRDAAGAAAWSGIRDLALCERGWGVGERRQSRNYFQLYGAGRSGFRRVQSIQGGE